MGIPRNATLAETIYRDIEKNDYLNQLYADLLYNYSLRLFSLSLDEREIDIPSALRFADILSKSAYTENADAHKIWAQEIIILLNILYPGDARVSQFLGSVLSAVGNYRGLQTTVKSYVSTDVMDQLYYAFDKGRLCIPGDNNKYFFPAQKQVFDGLGKFCFSYSGPTSMGKSFVVQTYIKQQIEAGVKQNFAILVPTKALINEVRSSILNDIQKGMTEHNYRVVVSAGDIVLQQNHNFIFVMTPERLLHLLNTMPTLALEFLFVDEAHKISSRGGRSAFYYKVINLVMKRENRPTVVFASPNIPNPEIYLDLIPGIRQMDVRRMASKFAPVCQFKYLVDMVGGRIFSHNDHSHKLEPVHQMKEEMELCDIISVVGRDKQNIVYCNARTKVVDYATAYAKTITQERHDPKLDALAKDIQNEVHTDCFLSGLIRKGIAYHVGYLPASIRLRIERCFEEGLIRTIFCTSTLVEGVNLPADNLFVTSYKNGNIGMNEVEFRNLIGRVGRIKYNLYGNVFLLAYADSRTDVSKKYESLLNNDIPAQQLSVTGKLSERQRRAIVVALSQGDVAMQTCLEGEKEEDYALMRKIALILLRDIVKGNSSTVTETFAPLLTAEATDAIIGHFGNERTSDDITLSYDQWENLTDAIEKGNLAYPALGVNDIVDFSSLVRFLARLRTIFKWDVYEKNTLGRLDSSGSPRGVLEWYATVLMQWVRGNGLSVIISSALRHKRQNPYKGIWNGKHQLCSYYDYTNMTHRNYVMAETLDVIENVILFSLANYFRKFSMEYKRVHGVEHFDNDWYEFVEYGTTNRATILLQQSGFSREVSQFILSHRAKYIDESSGEIKIKPAIFTCGDIGVETEANDVRFNIPELFIDDDSTGDTVEDWMT